MRDKKRKKFKSIRRAIYIRFTEKEWKLLQKMCGSHSQSAQDYLKYATFHFDKVPLMNKEDASSILAELKRIGNNFNQIARHLNSGLRYGWSDAFEKSVQELTQLREAVVQDVAS